APGDVVALEGDLGAGKTTLVRGLAEGVGADPDDVCSPTFVLVHVYRGGRIPLGHMDVHRLGPSADLAPLGVDDLLDAGAVAVEWAEWARLEAAPAARIRLAVMSERSRRATITDDSDERLRRAFAGALRR
ncbi:MAG TPA: tRNA (adenosine(37)-N6)-threonylcarbamoyltransferase complex ATPase subunit type 1 TsaE, partial [Candidatus Dormibacteraeota bacterium]|nr:tRNA (adenosine(37)-N6)-threonylcarbamoyltransferase complex ATPase subunit type 1 TsaE [Candidatus Dormibacteraeota bacterium]